ncbi:MAG: histidine--tRNA ligase [Flavobacteriales bacterium]|jgi:histidyl-tRNA synthetase
MKPSIAKGTRDFSAAEVQKRQHIMNVLREAFELRGFDPIETPSFENLDTLTGKYGEEGDRLIFKILRSGDFTSKIDDGAWAGKDPKTLGAKVADKALRYDLTVPFARYVVQHQNEIAFPFKRYQMQPVWRADRPQKGRFREFYQCDADVVGSDSLWQEVELVHLYDAAFTKLGLPTTIKINNRKILAGMAEVLGIKDQFISFTVAIDKLDKVGSQGVLDEMTNQGISSEAVTRFGQWLEAGMTLEALKEVLAESEEGQLGLEELEFVLTNSKSGIQSSKVEFDFTLARGLNYYTGTIFEVAAEGVAMGSVGGGGRYADLTSIFGLKNTSGVGISFGLDRIYLCLEELGLFPTEVSARPAILFANFGEAEAVSAYQWVTKLVGQGVRAELYPDATKLKKQFDFADKKGIVHMAMVGTNEMGAAAIPVKNLGTGEQEVMTLEQIVALLG